jgi:hypothetical protein
MVSTGKDRVGGYRQPESIIFGFGVVAGAGDVNGGEISK